MTKSNRHNWDTLLAFAYNFILVYVVYALCRIIFVLTNWGLYGETLFQNSWWEMIKGCWVFDTSAIIYTNLLYAVLMLIPCHWKEKDLWQKVARWVFVVVNSLSVIMNLCDCVYVQYTGRRTTVTVFSEFSNEENIGRIISTELLHHWYLVLLGVGLIALLWRVYRQPKGEFSLEPTRKNYLRYYLLHTVCFALFIPLCIAGMRGGFTTAVRPITISNANQYVNHPEEAAVVLNTPFSLIRTMGKTNFPVPNYFPENELDKIYSPVHQPNSGEQLDSLGNLVMQEPPEATHNTSAHPFLKKNVVVIIVESFGREFIGAYNPQLDNGQYKGYTPFVDKLYPQCLSFDYTFANGRKSIDGMPSILSSIPMFIEPFFLTPASMNNVSGLAGELDKQGYQTAFFHGAQNGSMGFQAFAKATGFQNYYGRTEYNQDPRFHGDKDFDGTWAIWDEPFLQFYATKMSEMKQPFMTAVFTASSHNPFVVPEQYKNTYPEEGGNPLHKCIRYTDHALERFFETASRQPWFKNTIFVLTSDHTNMPDHAEYKTDLGFFGSPILFYDPSGELIKAGRRPCIAEQIDIMPSILGLLGYPRPYVAFGQDLFHTSNQNKYAIHYNNGVYQFVQGDWMLQFDGEKALALYNYKADWMLQHNQLNNQPAVRDAMLKKEKAIIQSYMTRMNRNQLVVSKK